MKLKKHLTMLSAAIGVTAIAALPIAHLSKSTSNTVVNDSTQTASTSTKAASYTNYYTQGNLESISTTSGPVTLKENGKVVQSLDWYGNVNWSYDVSTLDKANSSTKVVDWNYLDINGWLFLITDKSTLIKIDASTGELKAILGQSASGIVQGANRIASIEFNNTMYVWNSQNKQPEISEVDRNTLKKKTIGTAIKTDDANNYLVNILPIGVGYNIGIFSNTEVKDDSNFSSATITMKFIDDNLKTIGSSSATTLSEKSTNNFKDFASYSFIRKNNTTNPLVIIDKTIYNVTLNKSDMSKSKMEVVEQKVSGTDDKLEGFVNSAFMDTNETVYLKTLGGKKIYQVNFNNIYSVFSDLSTSSNSTIKNIVNSTTNDNNLQIYGVPSTAENSNISFGLEKKYLASTMSLFASENPYITTIINSSIQNLDYTSMKPTIVPTKDTNISNYLPSSVKKTDFSSKNADSLDASQVKLTADDYNGTLTVKATVTKTAWYDQNVKTTSIINVTYGNNSAIKPKNLASSVSFATQSEITAKFKGYSPNQLVESDFENWTGMFKLTNGLSETSSLYKINEKKVTITSRDDTNGTIKLEGLISYTDQYGTLVSYSIPETSFTVGKGASTYALKFVGASGDAKGWMQSNGSLIENNNADIDVQNVVDETVSSYQKYLPSLIKTSMLTDFIEREDKYVISRKNISAVADDQKGELTITVMYDYVDHTKTPYKYVQKYTGFVTENQATVSFKGKQETDQKVLDAFANDKFKDNILDISTIPEFSDFDERISTLVQADQIYGVFSSKLENMGIKPRVTIEERQTVDDEYGSFVVTLDYSGGKDDETKLKASYANKFGLTNFKISQRYSGMLDIGNLYGLEVNQTKAKAVVDKYDVDSTIPTNELLSTLDIKGYKTTETNPSDNDYISVQSFNWDGENFYFTVVAQSKKYDTVMNRNTFVLSWAPKFRAIRERNMAIAISTSIVGAAIVSTAVTLYILRRNRIRRLLK